MALAFPFYTAVESPSSLYSNPPDSHCFTSAFIFSSNGKLFCMKSFKILKKEWNVKQIHFVNTEQDMRI